MTCELIAEAKSGKLTPESFQSAVKSTESIFSSDSFDVAVRKCTECGQLFIYCFREYSPISGNDDCWVFWIPVTQDEIERVKNAPILIKHVGELVNQAPHICWHPDGHVYWSENGFHLALIVFMP